MDSTSMNKDDRQAMMKSMMEQFFGGMGADEKKQMFASMMGKMTEGQDMTEMMPKMMMGMMSGGDGGPAKMQEMMSKMMQGGPEQHTAQMPEMMLKTMMPHCIGMMLPAIDQDKRGEVAKTILKAIVEKGSVGMSDEQRQSFLKTPGQAISPSS